MKWAEVIEFQIAFKLCQQLHLLLARQYANLVSFVASQS